MGSRRFLQFDANTNPYANTDSNAHPNSDTDTYSDTNAYSDANTDANWLRVQRVQGRYR
jgi:hypothetical protein